jgi:photosystem II stability/assembly factor-like uncharacterized protein
MRATLVVMLLAFAGCGDAVTDACANISGTCVSLRVQSDVVTSVDALHIVASGAATGDHSSAGGSASLPILVALELPATTSGELDLFVEGQRGGSVVGACSTSTNVTPGGHSTAVCTLIGPGDNDLSTGGDGGGGDGGNDGGVVACDPKGVIGPACVWRWQTPLPQGDNLLSVVAFGDSDTYALTVDGTVLHRDSMSWSTLTAQPTAATAPALGAVSTMFSFGGNSQDMWIGGTGYTNTTVPLVFHSPDRGLTWTQEALPGAATGFVGKGSTTGSYAILPGEGSGIVYARDNGGTWTSKTVPTSTAAYVASAMTFSDGVVVGATSGTTAAIAYTADDGATWTAVATASITPSTEFLQGVCLGNGTTKSWWAVGGSVILHGSGNSPTTWAQQGSGATAGATLEGCVATDSTHAWAFGTNGSVFVTTDGTNWAGVTTPPATTATLNDGAHSSGSALTLVGDQGAIFRSTNGGSSFTAEKMGPQDPLTTAYGVAPGNVYAVGPMGTIYHTADDGMTWSKLAAPSATGTTALLTGVWGSSATDVYAVGANGTIVHSTNGTTFNKYTGTGAPPTTTAFNDVWGSSAGVYAVGSDGTYPNLTHVVYRSIDQGVTWSQVSIAGFTGGAPNGTSVVQTVFAQGTDVWIGAEGGKVYYSSDGTIFSQQNTGGASAAITQIRGTSQLVMATLGTDPGTYISTTNKGLSWVAPTNPVFGDSAAKMVFVPDESAIYVFGAFLPPAVSYDQTSTWKGLITVMSPNAMKGGFAFANNDVFIVGDTGIIHYGN